MDHFKSKGTFLVLLFQAIILGSCLWLWYMHLSPTPNWDSWKLVNTSLTQEQQQLFSSLKGGGLRNFPLLKSANLPVDKDACLDFYDESVFEDGGLQQNSSRKRKRRSMKYILYYSKLFHRQRPYTFGMGQFSECRLKNCYISNDKNKFGGNMTRWDALVFLSSTTGKYWHARPYSKLLYLHLSSSFL